MNVIKQLCLSLFIGLCLTACGVQSQNLALIKPGMSETMVYQILGEPSARTFNRNKTTLTYAGYGVWHTIDLENGRVIALRRESMQSNSSTTSHANFSLGGTHNDMVRDMPFTPQVTRDRGFEAFFRELKDSFSSERMSKLSTCPRWVRYLDVEQTLRLLSLFNFSDDKYHALKILAPYIVHQGYIDPILRVFPFQKREVESLLSSYEPIVPSSRGFDTFYRSVKSEPFDDNKLSKIKLGARHRLFTVAQCVKLMNLFSFDDKKLEVLGYIHKRIIDGENVYQLLDALSFISSREQAKQMLYND